AFFRLNEDLRPTIRAGTETAPRLKDFTRPVRIIFGANDPYLNSGVARRFYELFPKSDLFLLPTARHFVQMDAPEEVARLILCATVAARVGRAIAGANPVRVHLALVSYLERRSLIRAISIATRSRRLGGSATSARGPRAMTMKQAWSSSSN